jgi:hypothetical protein
MALCLPRLFQRRSRLYWVLWVLGVGALLALTLLELRLM